MPELSIIICTHNPRPDYLKRVLDALRGQTLAKQEWELLLIDNASKEPLSRAWDLSWHPFARHIREEELGLTPARLRGIQEATGSILVFVDDDNVLDPGYLEKALLIRHDFKQLGAYGSANIKAEFEVAPRSEIVPYLDWLALRNEQAPLWSNATVPNRSLPYGAGLCVLREVAMAYAAALSSDKRRQSLDRRGAGLLCAGDLDMALFASKLTFGTGIFPELAIIHLIPARRLEPSYIAGLAEGNAASYLILEEIWNCRTPWRENSVMAVIRHLKRLMTLKGIEREVYQAGVRGRKWAHTWIAKHKQLLT